jgi:radical SAM superfamily enzyme YgiQ (UPF0313 family)
VGARNRMGQKKRILFGAEYSLIEPLGLLHLAGLARDEGWDRKICLIKDHDFTEFFELVKDYKPDMVGFNVYTGNHIQLFKAFQQLKRDNPSTVTIIGGPHASYFPAEAAKSCDYVVMSEGFGPLRRILRGEADPGVLLSRKTETFPHPDRQTLYDDYPEHRDSAIKSIISMTGCPYSCTYCYNSSTMNDIKDGVGPELADKLGTAMSMSGRLFPHNVRSIESVLKEGREVADRWGAQVIYFQDDVFGMDEKPNGFLENMGKQWRQTVGIPYHAQMRWEMTKSKKRLGLIRESGGFGLTLAIEAADAAIRKEVLNRGMHDDIVSEGMKSVIAHGFKIRTEQISGLPYGATQEASPINLEADLGLVQLNVDLRATAGGPTMAWASTLAPYKGTKLYAYCDRHGHYKGDNSDIPDTFFERSVLRFPKEWTGPSLAERQDDPSVWLEEDDLNTYKNQNAELRRKFNFFTLIPEGHKLAKTYLTSSEPFSDERLGKETEAHLEALADADPKAKELLEKKGLIQEMCDNLSQNGRKPEDLKKLSLYFACLPKSQKAFERFLRYGHNKGSYDANVLSTATRHHLYDEVLYHPDNL